MTHDNQQVAMLEALLARQSELEEAYYGKPNERSEYESLAVGEFRNGFWGGHRAAATRYEDALREARDALEMLEGDIEPLQYRDKALTTITSLIGEKK